MNKKPFQSKKFIALVVGVSFTSIFTLVSLVLIGLFPSASSAIVNLMTVSLASINGVIGLYAVGQSAVDWRINSSHNTQNTVDRKEILIEESKNYEMQYEGERPINYYDVDYEDKRTDFSRISN